MTEGKTFGFVLAAVLILLAVAAFGVYKTDEATQQPMECISVVGPVGGTICAQGVHP